MAQSCQRPLTLKVSTLANYLPAVANKLSALTFKGANNSKGGNTLSSQLPRLTIRKMATAKARPTTGASHASHLGCPSAYSSRLSYIKKRQVWKSRSETDWPRLGIIPGFSTEKNRSILMLTSTCWQEISLSNTVELTTVTPQKQKICRFKRCFLPVFENSRGSIVCLRAANLVMCYDWAVLFLRTSPVSVWQPADQPTNQS